MNLTARCADKRLGALSILALAERPVQNTAAGWGVPFFVRATGKPVVPLFDGKLAQFGWATRSITRDGNRPVAQSTLLLECLSASSVFLRAHTAQLGHHGRQRSESPRPCGKLGGMDSRDLTTEQAAKIRDAIRPHLAYLRRLQVRMERRGFIPTDELFQAATRAYDATHDLWVMLHYLSCRSGVYRSPRVETGAFATWG
jgi:hypothetical protein